MEVPCKVEDIVFELTMLFRGSRAGKKIVESVEMPSNQQQDESEG